MDPKIRYLRIESGAEPPEMDLKQSKTILLVDEEAAEIWQCELSRSLVNSGCRLVMVWGMECESWCEKINEANLEAWNYEEIPEDHQVTATAHEGEELSDVFWFAKHRAHHPVLQPGEPLILHISSNDKQSDLLRGFEEA